jgi:D-alanyl-D-alanine carboxypeptidase
MPPLSDLESRIDAAFAREVESSGPGAVVGVLRDGAFVHRKAYGLAEVEHGVALTPESVFRIASLTKQFTAAAVMLLAQRGSLQVDAPIERYLAGWRPRGAAITVRRLLNHTSGIWRHDSTEPPRTDRPNTPIAEILERIYAAPVEYEPGERYAYNNSGYQLLGAIVAAVSGREYGEFLRAEFFEPLGMTRTGVFRHEAIVPGRARGYVPGRRGLLNARPDSMNWSFAAGSLHSTLDDLARWDRAIRAGRIIEPATREAMLEPTLLNDGSVFPYGFGLGLGSYAGRRLYHHTGGISGFATQMLHLRDEDLTTIVLSNRYLFPIDPLTRAVLRAALDLPEPAGAELKLDNDQLEACAGRFSAPSGLEQTFRAVDGGLAILADGRATLAATSVGVFHQMNDPEITFAFSEPLDGRFQRLTIRSPLWPDEVLDRAG